MFDIQGGKEYFLAASDAFSCVGYFKCAGSKKKKKKKGRKNTQTLKSCVLSSFFLNKKIKQKLKLVAKERKYQFNLINFFGRIFSSKNAILKCHTSDVLSMLLFFIFKISWQYIVMYNNSN